MIFGVARLETCDGSGQRDRSHEGQGHKTPSMVRRYSIVTDDEAASALLRVDAMIGKRPKIS